MSRAFAVVAGMMLGAAITRWAIGQPEKAWPLVFVAVVCAALSLLSAPRAHGEKEGGGDHG